MSKKEGCKKGELHLKGKCIPVDLMVDDINEIRHRTATIHKIIKPIGSGDLKEEVDNLGVAANDLKMNIMLLKG